MSDDDFTPEEIELMGHMIQYTWEFWNNEENEALMQDDTVREKPSLERKHEWEHGREGEGEKCGRYNKKVYTNPGTAPGTCRQYDCNNTEYYSKGIVIREKGTKEIVDREKK